MKVTYISLNWLRQLETIPTAPQKLMNSFNILNKEALQSLQKMRCVCDYAYSLSNLGRVVTPCRCKLTKSTTLNFPHSRMYGLCRAFSRFMGKMTAAEMPVPILDSVRHLTPPFLVVTLKNSQNLGDIKNV